MGCQGLLTTDCASAKTVFEIDNGIWDVYFGPVKLGRLIEEQMRIEDGAGKLWRHKKKV